MDKEESRNTLLKLHLAIPMNGKMRLTHHHLQLNQIKCDGQQTETMRCGL